MPGVTATGPQDFEDQVGSAAKILNAIIFGLDMFAPLVEDEPGARPGYPRNLR